MEDRDIKGAGNLYKSTDYHLKEVLRYLEKYLWKGVTIHDG